MLTDRPPGKLILRTNFLDSDTRAALDLPHDDRLETAAKSIERSLERGVSNSVRMASTEFLEIAADFYKVPKPDMRVLRARPLRSRERGWAVELFGDYNPERELIRVWMRTAIRKEVTSFGTFLSTLCHEFCHHLDYQRFGYADSWHTRGFYERTAVLYHRARGTPLKRLFWIKAPGGRWRINWAQTNRRC